MLVPLKSEKRPKGEPVYRDPDNPFNTWTGIGKRPAWLTAKLDAGISLEAMKMQGVANPREQQNTATPGTQKIPGPGLAADPHGSKSCLIVVYHLMI
ncbi:H-NS histone family [Klebsiella pneumoniae]|nr:H-NS histone family [Klebsiella pneumoniae]